MEEPHFIKCESDWLPFTESSPKVNADEEAIPVSVEKIKVEPDLAFTGPCAEEYTLGVVKEELDIQDVKEEHGPELDDTGGPCIKQVNPVLLCPVAEGALINSVQFSERIRPNESLEAVPHNEDTTKSVSNVFHGHLNSLLPSYALEHNKGTSIGKNGKVGPCCDGCSKTLIGPGYSSCSSKKKQFCMTCIDMYSQCSDDIQHSYVQSESRVCSACGKLFNAQRTLENHMLSHKSRKTFDCEKCGKGFTRKFTLKIHSRIHTGERRHVCSECGNSFYQLVQLRTHMLIHEQSLPHKCSICGRAFGLRTRLYKHILQHTERDGFTLKGTE